MALQVGITVRVGESNQLLRLMAVEPFTDPAVPRERRRTVETAFVRPLNGGREHGYPVNAIEPVCDHPRLEERPDGKYCADCKALIYSINAAKSEL
jgi:hypothetical protein